jgi:stage III sporulation protein AE
MKKTLILLMIAFALSFLLCLPVSATEDAALEGLFDDLPDRVKEEFDIEGDNVESDVESLGEAVVQKSSADQIISKLLEAARMQADEILKLFATICALLIVSSVFRTTSSSLDNDALGSAIRFCAVGALFAMVVYSQYSQFERVEGFFNSVGEIMRGMIPVSATVWALGGNLGSASVGSSSLYLMLNVSEGLFGMTVIPVCGVISVLGLCEAISDEMKTGRLLAAIKKIYGFFLGIVMTVLLSSLAAQTAISAAADSTTARTARMVSGSFIPILGGSIAETLRTVSGGVAYLKNILGIGGILMIVGTLAPIAMSLLLTRVTFLITAGLADLLGCTNESRLLENLGEAFGIMLAVCVSVSVMFVLSLCIFMQSVIAVA